jgi:hypothetical protein
MFKIRHPVHSLEFTGDLVASRGADEVPYPDDIRTENAASCGYLWRSRTGLMPRSFSNWNEHRRQGVHLFQVPNLPCDALHTLAENASSHQDDQQLSSSFNDLEELVDQLLEGSSPPEGFLSFPTSSSASTAAASRSQPFTPLAFTPYQGPSTSIAGFDPRVDHVGQDSNASMLQTRIQASMPLPTTTTTQPAHLPRYATLQAHAATSNLQLPQCLGQPADQPAAFPSAAFTWQERQECLVESDFNHTPIEYCQLPAAGTNPIQVSLAFSPPLLYWQDRRQWMWHKKWALPTLTVRVCRSDHPVGERLYAFVTAGTLRDDEPGLHDKGLGGECQRLLEVSPQGTAEVSFSRLFFQQTSFNCGNRPFRIVVMILSAPPRLAMPGSFTPSEPSSMHSLRPLVCLCSCPVHVDARKRSKGERPEARDDDVRLVQRQRPTTQQQGQLSDHQHQHQQQQQQQQGGFAGWLGSLTSGIAGQSHQHTAMPPTIPTALMDAAGDSFIEVCADGVVVRMLTSSAFGYTPPQLVGRSLLNIVHPDDHTGLMQTLKALLMMASTHVASTNVDGRYGARGRSSGGGGGGGGGGSNSAPSPKSLRVLHRVLLGLGSAQTPEPVAVDSIVSVSTSNATAPPNTLWLCSRIALPIAADPVTAFSFTVMPAAGGQLAAGPMR